MPSPDQLLPSDAAVVARYLQLRALLQDRHLAGVERLMLQRYEVQPTRPQHATLTVLFRGGFVRPAEGEIWPVVFLTPIDVYLSLCFEISAERVAGLGTQLNGPQRIRHRHWEDWWGWEQPLAALHPRLFELDPGQQEEVVAAWYARGLEWLAHGGLLRRKEGLAS
jgi:hypothetical protein